MSNTGACLNEQQAFYKILLLYRYTYRPFAENKINNGTGLNIFILLAV